MRKITSVIIIALTLSVMAGCSSIDCSLNSLVHAQYKFLTPSGEQDTLHDTLTITTNTLHGDTILLNRACDITEFSLPVSYTLDSDTLYFHFRNKQGTAFSDKIVMKKTNISHFESVDCPPTFFHDIENLEFSRNRIDSVAVNDKQINNDTSKKNIYIYLKPGI